MNVGERLYELRKKYGYSQEDIAYKLQVTRQTVSKWENNMTTPELSKAVELCKLYGITVESLTANDKSSDYVEKNDVNNDFQDCRDEYKSESKSELKGIGKFIVHEYRYRKVNYQYKSKAKIGNVPLVDINIGWFNEKKKGNGIAKGIIAIGNVSIGLISIGILSIGLFSIGILALGLFIAFGTIAIGTYAIGAIAIGMMSIGAVSIGYMSIGAMSIGNYSIGACAIANQIAIGAYANGLIAFGDEAVGQYVYLFDSSNYSEVLNAIQTYLPETPKWVYNIFKFFLG